METRALLFVRIDMTISWLESPNCTKSWTPSGFIGNKHISGQTITKTMWRKRTVFREHMTILLNPITITLQTRNATWCSTVVNILKMVQVFHLVPEQVKRSTYNDMMTIQKYDFIVGKAFLFFPCLFWCRPNSC